jgi:predicted extracellular nuclease
VKPWVHWATAAVVATALAACRGPADEPFVYTSTTSTGTTTTTTELDAGPEPGLRIATFNVRRFFDTVCDSDDCGYGAYEDVPTQAQFEARSAQIVDAIDRIDAGIVLLQEVETWVCLASLAYAMVPRYPTVVLGEIGGPATVDVAVLAEGALLLEQHHRQIPLPLPSGGTTTFAREFLELQLEVEGQLVVVFVAHFKSKHSDDPERRLAEATAAQLIVTSRAAELPDALVVLGGDLNDTPGSEPLDAIEQGGWLLRVASDLPPGEDATYYYNGTGVALDHLFLAVAAGGSYLPGSAQVIQGSAGGLGGSDHAAVSARFELPD